MVSRGGSGCTGLPLFFGGGIVTLNPTGSLFTKSGTSASFLKEREPIRTYSRNEVAQPGLATSTPRIRSLVGVMKMIGRMTILSLMAVVLIGCAPQAQERTQPMSARTSLTRDDAIRISRQACDGKVDVPADTQAIVTETNGNFVVTFPQPLQPDILHGDYYARVTIQKATGKIVEILASP